VARFGHLPRAILGLMRDARQTGFGSRAILALLLVGALLVCHGLLGTSHVLAHGGPPVSEQPAGRSSASHQGAGHAAAGQAAGDDVPAAAHAGATEYFAVLLVLAGAALLGVLLVLVRSPLGDGAPRTLPLRWWLEPQPLSRGHSPPFLQVFRL